MLKNINKKSTIIYMGILITTLLFCQNFLQMHYSSDTYVLYDLGYMNYPAKYFLLDGRIVSTIVCYIAGILNVPIPTYIISMDFIGIIFIASSIYLISKLLINIIKPKNNILKLMLIAGSFVLILNQFTLEYLVFPESAVMCLGVFLNVLAIKFMVEEPKHKYIKIFITLTIATLCYQGLLNMFPILAILIYIVKQITEDKETKVTRKEFIIEMLKLAFIVILALVICIMVVKLDKILLNSKQDRSMHLVNMEAVYLRARIISEYINQLWNHNMNMLPSYINNIIIAITFVSLLLLKTKKEAIIRYILLIVVAFVICITPIFLFNTGICGRVNEPISMIWGVSIIILLAQINTIKEGKRTNFIYALVIISFIINNIYIMQNITEHIASNRVEENMGRTIKYAIEKYEEETGYVVTKFAYVYDQNPQQYAVGIKEIGSLTERKFACSWSIIQALEFYCQRDFKTVGISMDMYTKVIPKKDFTEFSEEQLIFNEDALYMIVY